MKRVIRKGLFETNSSSSHSLTIKKNTVSKQIEEGASFEIRSKLAKTVWLLGIIDSSLDLFDGRCGGDEYKETLKIVRNDLLEEIKKCKNIDMELVEKKLGDISGYSFMELIDNVVFPYGEAKDLDVMLDKIEDGNSTYMKELNRPNYDKLVRYREAVVETFCSLEKLTKEEAMEKLYYEEYRNFYIEKELKKRIDSKEALEKFVEENYGSPFSIAYNESKEKDIVSYARWYLDNYYKEEVKKRDVKFVCDRYFSEGSLYECDCGFETVDEVIRKLKLENIETYEDMLEHAKDFLLYKRVVAREEYSCLYFMKTGEIY